MAKKSGSREGRRVGDPNMGTATRRPSPLLDTRVVYCGDSLEQPGRMQKEEGRMMKLARFQILHSSFCLLNSSVTGSFYYHYDWHACRVMAKRLRAFARCRKANRSGAPDAASSSAICRTIPKGLNHSAQCCAPALHWVRVPTN
jgi:hypothetical protein